MSPGLVVAMLGGLALVVYLGILSDRAARRRLAALAALCRSRGWSFSQDDDDAPLEERFPDFECLQQGDNRHVVLRMEGPVPAREGGIARRLCAFDYRFDTHSVDSKGHRQTQRHQFSAVILECEAPLRPLSLRPETFFDRVGEFFGMDDIDFESAEFSRAFHVKAADRKWAFDVIGQDTMEFLLASPRFQLEIRAGGVLAWSGGLSFGVAEYEAALDVANGVLDRLPGYLLREWKESQA